MKLSRCVSVRYLHMCAKFHVSTVKSCRENPDWGGVRRFIPPRLFIEISSIIFQEFKSCFSTSLSQIDFLCFLMTGANIAGPVFLPKNTFIEQWCQFHYWPFEFVIFCRSLSENFCFVACLSVVCCVLSILQWFSSPYSSLLTIGLFSTESHNSTEYFHYSFFPFGDIVFPVIASFIIHIWCSLNPTDCVSFEPSKGIIQKCFCSFNSTSIINSTSKE